MHEENVRGWGEASYAWTAARPLLCALLVFGFANCGMPSSGQRAQDLQVQDLVAPVEPQPRNVFLEGRPANAHVLRFARDKKTCANFLAAMNEARPYTYSDEAHRFDLINYINVFLGSRVSLAWQERRGADTPLSYVVADIDNDGVNDYVYRNTTSINDHSLQKLIVSANPPAAPADLNESMLRAAQTRSADPKFADLAAAEVVLDVATIDMGRGLPADIGDWELGQFIELARVDGKIYAVTGGNWERIVRRDWFPVRLIEVHGKYNHRLICELLPKYRNQ